MNIRRAVRTSATLVVATLALGACASSGGGGDSESSEYTKNMGSLLVAPLVDGLDKVLAKHQIAIRRTEDQYQRIFYESEWKPMEVTEEQRMAGVTAARGRMILEGRRAGGTEEFRTTFRAEYQERTSMEPNWHPGPANEPFMDFWRTVASDLELEVRAGVRR